MRAVRADPTLLGRALAGDAASMTSLRAVAQGAAVPGSGIETRTDEERSLVVQMVGEGKSGAEIQAALDQHRANGQKATAEKRRNTPGVAVVSTPLPRIKGPWLAETIRNENGAPIPAQIAEKLVGQRFSDFGKLREAVWRLVAQTPELAREFNEQNLRLMRDGSAPYLPRSEQVVIRRTGQLSNGRGSCIMTPQSAVAVKCMT